MTDAARTARRSWFPWVLMGAVLLIALTVGALGTTGASTNEERVQEISRTIKCPECRGETVAESNSGLSQQIRIEIAKKVQSGATDDQIRADIGGLYNNAVLLTPESSGVAGLVWVIPVVALVAALAALALTFRDWGRRTPRHATEADRELVAAAMAKGPRRSEPSVRGAQVGVERPGDDEPVGA